ncbi:MAG TPA: preprotein translocase subunit SecG [Flavobacteriaceae bacterium]|jgi:preprotein translocase subunit SecG|nr:preprotein translocase subunit SecG [Flavobacteriaceae bacterium]|tara:strand:+ start:86 stop:418 length:333 start_codon:yes stop_codon:yes gene_type:complete
MGTFWIFISLILFVCFLLILVIMVQNPKGGGLSSTFGGGQQQIGGVQKTTDFLDKSTWVLAIVLGSLILISNVSLMDDVNDSESILIDESTIEETIPEVPEIPENAGENN